MKSLPDGMIRVSMRSKNKAINVCDVAKVFGGGGHAMAAGIRTDGTIESVRDAVSAELRDRLDAIA